MLCMLAATTFWFFSALNKSDYTTRLQYPLNFVYNQDSTYLLSSLPENINIEVSGGGWNLLRKTLLFDTPPIDIELNDPVNTKYITGESLSEELSEQLGDVRLTTVITDTLYINIDEAAEKEVVLAINPSSIPLGDSYQLVSPINLSSKTAVVRGPRTVLSSMQDTLMLNLPDPDSEINTDFEQSIEVSYNRSDLVSITPEEVNVWFRVAPFDLVTRTIEVTPVNFPDDTSLQLSTKRVKVTFWVQNEYKDLIDGYNFEVVANLRTLNVEDSTLTPVLKTYPDFAKNIAISPSKLRIENVQ